MFTVYENPKYLLYGAPAKGFWAWNRPNGCGAFSTIPCFLRCADGEVVNYEE